MRIDMLQFLITLFCSFIFFISFSWFSPLTASTVPGAAEAIDFINDDVRVVVEFAIDWSMQAALAATSTHAFIVVAKKFLD
jgi:hypothetical protein